MSATIIDGSALARKLRSRIRKQVRKLPISPSLAVVQVGDNPASTVYVSHKEKDCGKVGIEFTKHHLPEQTSQDELLELVQTLNEDATIHGILVQMPLPKAIDPFVVLEVIDPLKDVDGLHSANLGQLALGFETRVPGTPRGIIEMLDAYDIPIEGKQAVVVGRSILVGKPIALLLLNRHATVTICHSRTGELCDTTREADILVAAVGKPGLITREMVKPGAVVIDVAINHVDGKMVGDVDFRDVQNVASAITPVPGGVGPMTRAMMLQNTLEAMRAQTN